MARTKQTVEKGRGGSRENKKKVVATAKPEVFFLSGTLSYPPLKLLSDTFLDYVIEGVWWEKEYPQIKQRFVLSHTPSLNEDPNLEDTPKDGEFEGSYNYENECFPERVKLSFKHLEGKSKGKFIVNGTGTNQFGNFELFGTATKSNTDESGRSTYGISLRKWYSNSDSDPPPAPKASKAATTPLTTPVTTPVVWEKAKLKDNKRRKNTIPADDEKAGKSPKKARTRSKHMDKKQTKSESTGDEANMAESGAAKGRYRKCEKPPETIATSPAKLGPGCVDGKPSPKSGASVASGAMAVRMNLPTHAEGQALPAQQEKRDPPAYAQLEAKYGWKEAQLPVADNQDPQTQHGQNFDVNSRNTKQSSHVKKRAKNYTSTNKEGFANKTAQSMAIRSSPSQGPDNRLMTVQEEHDYSSLFMQALMKYLKERDTEMYAEAKIVAKEIYDNRKPAGPNLPSLVETFKSRLRSLVGDSYWKEAQKYADHFVEQKRLQKQQQQLSQQQGHSLPIGKQAETIEAQTDDVAKDWGKCPRRPDTPKSAGDDVTIMTENGAAKSSGDNEAKCDKPSKAIAISPVKLWTGSVDSSKPSTKSGAVATAGTVAIRRSVPTLAKGETLSAHQEKTPSRAYEEQKTELNQDQARRKQKDNINDADSKQKAMQAILRQDAPVDEEENSGQALPVRPEKRPSRAYYQQETQKYAREEAQNERKDITNDADSKQKAMPANRGQDAPVDEEEDHVPRDSHAATNSVAIKLEDSDDDDDDSVGNCHFQLVLSSKVTDLIIKVPRRRNISFQRLRSEIDEEELLLPHGPYKFTLHAGGATRLGPKQEQNWKKWNIWEYLTKQGDGSCLNPYHVFIEEE